MYTMAYHAILKTFERVLARLHKRVILIDHRNFSLYSYVLTHDEFRVL